VESDRSGRWRALPELPYRQAGFSDDEALIDFPSRSHPAYRLLTEYFAFPAKFDFVDFDLGALASAAGRCQRLFISGSLDGPGLDETLAMQNYLIQHGVEPHDIVPDRAGDNT
ncbi:type VI secretion system baseplate subunit TssF, partial [Achromobacter sp. SIMBA_011]|uniref:type VI secretion system baseplate subunit TssF n=1 Tax=Achromobacter sp. SIMBA_011 TaxID=3085759 RepID=UPI00397D3547